MRYLAILLPILLAGCSDPAGTISAAEALGFRDVQPEGYVYFGCNKDGVGIPSLERELQMDGLLLV
jgi:hypothetical protein